MKDILAWFGLKKFPFDKNIKTQDLFDAEPLKECSARLDFIKRRGGILLLTGDPGVGKTIALRRYVDSLNENLFKPFYTPLSTLSRSDLLYHINRLLGLTPRLSKSAIYNQIQTALLESKEQSGKTILLIIDEAHLLQTGPLEELRDLEISKIPFIMSSYYDIGGIEYEDPDPDPERSLPVNCRIDCSFGWFDSLAGQTLGDG